MKIDFNKVVPIPMLNETFDTKSVWNNTLTLDTQTHCFLQSASGKGKSTFTAYLIGLRTDYNGTIHIDGNNQKDISLNSWAQLRATTFAFLAQDMRLFPNLTVMENLIIKNTITDFVTTAQIQEMLEQLELDHKANQLAGTLSLGQQQRVAIIRSLLQPFEFLIMDEPFSHIDDQNITKAMAMISKACKHQNAGYLLTTLGYDYGIKTNQKLYLL